MPDNKATITGKAGPGNQATGAQISDVTAVKFDIKANIIEITSVPNKITHMSMEGVTTISFTRSGNNNSITVS